jgi:hypothetical protein
MKIWCLNILLFVSAAVGTAQELGAIHRADTLTLKILVFPGPRSSLSSPSFLPPARLSDTAIYRDFPTSFLGYALISEPAIPDQRMDLSWKMGITQSKVDPLASFRTVLRALSEGGAAYIAYQHIRKYGFLK